MAKKRSMPHGRTIPKARRTKLPTAMPVSPAAEQSESNGASTVTVPPPVSTVTAPRSVLRSTPTRGSRSAPGLSTDYRYVISDLKRIGIIAAAMFALIFGLSFVVR